MTRFMRRGDHRVAAAAALTATLSTGLLVTAGSGGLAGARDVVRGSRPTAAAAPAASHAEPLVVLLSDHVVRAAPDAHAHRVATVAGRRPRRPVRAGHQRPLDRLPRVRGRPRAGRGARDDRSAGRARHGRLARLRPPQPARDALARGAHRPGRAADGPVTYGAAAALRG